MILALINLIWDALSVGFSVFMEISRLTLEYLRVLVWPAAVLTLALIYRRPLVSVLHRLRKASGWGVSVEAEAAALARDSQISTLVEDAEASSPEVETAGAEDPEVGPPASIDSQEDKSVEAPSASPTSDVRPSQSKLEETSQAKMIDAAIIDAAFDRLLQRTSPRGHLTHKPPYSMMFRMPGRTTTKRNTINLSDEPSARYRRLRIETAWTTLIGIAYSLGFQLGMPPGDRTVDQVVETLSDQGFVKVGSWRIASRLTELYNDINAIDEVPSEATATDFITAAENLTSTLQNVEARLHRRTARSVNESLAQEQEQDADRDEGDTEP